MKDADLRAMSIWTRLKSEQTSKKAKRFYKPWDLDKRLDLRGVVEEPFTSVRRDSARCGFLKAGEKPRDPDALIIEVPMIYSRNPTEDTSWEN